MGTSEFSYKDETALERLYHGDMKTLEEIADMFDIHNSTVLYWMDKFDIERRDHTKPVEKRFHNRYEVNEETGCWEWTAGGHHFGYGQICIDAKTRSAHRVSYELHKGEIPEGAFICHKCHNPECVNPDHLYAGDPESNAQDAIEDGAWPTVEGEDHPVSKLTPDDIREIRRLYESGDHSQRELGEKFDVEQTNIEAIVNRRTWKHVD